MNGIPNSYPKGPGGATDNTLRVVLADDSPGIGGGGTFVASAGNQAPTAEDVEGSHIIYGQSVAGTITLPDAAAVGDRVSVINLADITTNVAATSLAGRAVTNPTAVVGSGAWATFTYAGADTWNAAFDTGPRVIPEVEITGNTVISDANYQDYHGRILRVTANATIDVTVTVVGFQALVVANGAQAAITATGETILGGDPVVVANESTATIARITGALVVATSGGAVDNYVDVSSNLTISTANVADYDGKIIRVSGYHELLLDAVPAGVQIYVETNNDGDFRIQNTGSGSIVTGDDQTNTPQYVSRGDQAVLRTVDFGGVVRWSVGVVNQTKLNSESIIQGGTLDPRVSMQMRILDLTTVTSFALGSGGTRGISFSVVNRTGSDATVTTTGLTMIGNGTLAPLTIADGTAASFLCLGTDTWFVQGQVV